MAARMTTTEHDYPERFDVREVLTRNDAEIVVRAFDRVLEREVLLKRLGPGARAHVGLDKSRAMREARALARVRNPHVLQLFEVIEEPTGPLLVLEPVAGETVADRIAREGPLSVEETLRIGRETCAALDAIHREGIVHRGVSCSNLVQREDGTTCLGGFSLAKQGDGMGQSSLNYRSGDSFKTRILVPHPAPEQVAGQPADARSDIFGLGCVLFECLAGHAAFPNSITTGPPPNVHKSLTEAPKALREVVRKCLSRSPMERYPTAEKLAAALVLEPSVHRPAQARRWGYKAAAALVVVGLGVFAANEFLGKEKPSGDMKISRGRRVTTLREPYVDRYRKSVAILIGIGYEDNPYFSNLPNAESDIERVEKALAALPLEWKIVKISGPKATCKAIRTAWAELRQLGENDRALIYYAGHGVRVAKGSTGYLIPADAVSGSKDPSYDRWISFDEIHALSGQTLAKHVLVALDCCNSGRAIGPRRGGIAEGDLAFLREALQHESKLILTAGRKNEEVPDDSIFCDRFVAALSPKNKGGGYLTAHSLFAQIQGGRSNAQMGALSGNGEGEFLFVFAPPESWKK